MDALTLRYQRYVIAAADHMTDSRDAWRNGMPSSCDFPMKSNSFSSAESYILRAAIYASRFKRSAAAHVQVFRQQVATAYFVLLP